MKTQPGFKKARYAKPRVISKRVEFIMETFGTFIGFGPYREAPRRPGPKDETP